MSVAIYTTLRTVDDVRTFVRLMRAANMPIYETKSIYMPIDNTVREVRIDLEPERFVGLWYRAGTHSYQYQGGNAAAKELARALSNMRDKVILANSAAHFVAIAKRLDENDELG